MNDKPVFPITVLFLEDGDKWVLNNLSELECNLEWFDSKDKNENAQVTDNNGKPVILVVEKLKLKLLELAC